MATPESTIQTRSERRAAEAELGALVERFAPDHARLVADVRRLLRKRMASSHEVVYEYRDCVVISVSPSLRGYEGIFGIRAEADGVKLYFNSGKSLPDPEKLLKGSGTQVRWISLKSASTLTQPAVETLIAAALAHNKVAFDDDGAGSITVRKTTASTARKPSTKSKAATKSKVTQKRTAAKQAKRSG